MALASLVVRIGADLSGLDRDLVKADRLVEKFSRKAAQTGRSLERMGSGAATAAASLSRLSGVMPGVLGGTATMVANLGAASVVMGETAILGTALTKSWRLLGVASTAVAASGLPAWLASLASPAGLAVLAVAALAGAVYGLKKAWDSATTSGRNMAKVLEDYRKSIGASESVGALKEQTARLQADFDAVTAALNAERSKRSSKIQMTGQGQIEVGGPNPGAVARLAATQKLIAEQMLAVGERLKVLMADAAETAEKKWKDLSKSIAEVMGPLGALSGSNLVSATSRDFAGEAIGRILDPSALGEELRRSLGQGLPAPGIQPAPDAEKKFGIGDQIMGMIGNAGGGIVEAFAAFGPMAAILPVISGALEALAPALDLLLMPLQLIGQLLGGLLAPIIRNVSIVLSYFMEGLGWVVRGIGRLVDALPGVSARGVINAGQAMIDAAQAARRNAGATDAATDAVNEFAGALSNIPRVLNLNALRHMVTGGSAIPGGTGGGGGGTAGGGGMGPIDGNEPANITFNFYVNDASEVADRVGRVLDARSMRGGTSRLTLAVAQ